MSRGYLENYIKTIQMLQKDGVPKEDALSCLEFDSDEYPDPDELKQALEIVYKEGSDGQV